MKNISGKKFGRLLAIKPTNKRACGRVIWQCKCDCGKTTEIYSAHLISGNSVSCGCFKKEQDRLPKGESGFNAVLADYKQRSRIKI
jgi:hypothetical protein